MPASAKPWLATASRAPDNPPSPSFSNFNNTPPIPKLGGSVGQSGSGSGASFAGALRPPGGGNFVDPGSADFSQAAPWSAPSAATPPSALIDPNNPVARGYKDPNFIGQSNAGTTQGYIDRHNQSVALQRALQAKIQGLQSSSLNPDNAQMPKFAPPVQASAGSGDWLGALIQSLTQGAQ